MNTDWLILGFLLLPGLIMLVASLTVFLLKKLNPVVVASISTILFLSEVIVSLIIWVSQEGGFNVQPVRGLAMDWLSLCMLTISSIAFLIASLFSIYYIDKTRFGVYFTLLGSLQLGVNLVIMANHFFFLFIFWELMVISGYILVVFENNVESYEAGFKYLVMSSIGSLFILLGTALLSSIVPDLYFDRMEGFDILSTFTGKLALSSLIVGFGVTAGMIALNQWLPDAHPAAPAPISALLSGIIVKLGIYGIYRSLTVLLPSVSLNYAPTTIIVIIAVLTMTEGNIMVLSQFMRTDTVDLKRIFAYSTTVHLGYLLLVVGVSSELGNLALIFHIINHALAKGLLFMISGYLLHEYGSKDLKLLPSFNIGLNDKTIAISTCIALFSLGGLPLTGGFVSKFLVLISFYEQAGVGSEPTQTIMTWVLVFAVINSAIAFAGYLWIIRLLFFNQEDTVETTPTTQGQYIKILFLTLAGTIVVLGIFPYLLINPLLSLIP